MEQRDGQVVLRVRDSGIGIAAEDLERVFEPFIKSRNPLANATSGLGLGLSLVRRILELHRGRHQGHQRRSREGERVCRHAACVGDERRDNPGPESLMGAPIPLASRARGKY